MSKVKILSILVICLLAINVGLVVFMISHKPPHHTHDGPKEIIAEKLHFNKEQVQEYEALIEEHQQEAKMLNDKLNGQKNELYSLLVVDENQSAKDSLIAEIGRTNQEIELAHFAHFKALRNICDPDQAVYFEELTKDLMALFNQKPAPPRR